MYTNDVSTHAKISVSNLIILNSLHYQVINAMFMSGSTDKTKYHLMHLNNCQINLVYCCIMSDGLTTCHFRIYHLCRYCLGSIISGLSNEVFCLLFRLRVLLFDGSNKPETRTPASCGCFASHQRLTITVIN